MAEQRTGIFYGWFLLAALLVAYTATNGIIVNTMPLFFPILQGEMGLTAQQMTAPSGLLFFLIAISSVASGAMLERYSPKFIMLGGSVVLVAAFVVFGHISSYGQFLGVYVLFALGLTTAGIIASMFLITRWFGRYRGRAVGILLTGSSLGAVIFPQIVGPVIRSSGWRTAALVLSGIMAVTVVVPFVFVLKDRPEDVGTTRDGVRQDTNQPSESSTPRISVAEGVTLAQALRTPVFYLLCFVTAVMWFCIVGVTQNQTLYFKDLQLSLDVSKNVLSVFGASAMLGKLLFGFLSDRFDKKMIMLVATVNLTVGSLMLRFLELSPESLIFPYAIIYGLGFSGAFTMIQVMVAEYYAGASYGKILGAVTMVDTLAGSAGAIGLGSIRTATGSYIPAFTLMVVLCVAASVVVVALKKPHTAV